MTYLKYLFEVVRFRMQIYCLLFISLWSCTFYSYNIIPSSSSFSSSTTPSISTGVYIHIPFCRRRCFYCDFPVEVIGDRKSTQFKQGAEYVKTLLQDMDTTFTHLLQHEQQQQRQQQKQTKQANQRRPNIPAAREITSVYFGGGTPSLLDPQCKCVYIVVILWTQCI